MFSSECISEIKAWTASQKFQISLNLSLESLINQKVTFNTLFLLLCWLLAVNIYHKMRLTVTIVFALAAYAAAIPDGYNKVTKTVTQTATVTKPITQTVTVTKPIRQTVTVTKPITQTVTVTKPIKTTVTVTKPVKTTVTVTKPVKTTVTVTKPVKTTVTVTKPITQTVTPPPVTITKVVVKTETKTKPCPTHPPKEPGKGNNDRVVIGTVTVLSGWSVVYLALVGVDQYNNNLVHWEKK
ncbi:hypothetical protein F5884DRAFT_256121 [Xylogone sp. PMI_703]|nr:hypothetical protein F5884DRAFT_256121 [Xylogone sp. PMI_703]